MKKLLITLILGLMVFSASPVLAATSQNELPTWLTYTTEWLNLNLLTWKSESKVKVLDNYATKRVKNIQVADQNGSDQNIAKLADQYLQIKEREKPIKLKPKISQSRR